jgi:hypothetical protein
VKPYCSVLTSDNMQLETKHAQEIIGVLEDAEDVGLKYVAFELRPEIMDLRLQHIYYFEKAGHAIDYVNSKNQHYQSPGPGIPYPVHYMTIEQMLSELQKANPLTINKIDMNRNNLENLKEELKKLGFKDKVAGEMEKQIEKGVPEFTLNDKVNGTKGQVDLTLHFRQSGQSDNYYFNKFEVALNTGKGLEEGQKYMVITPNEQAPGKNLVKSFENVTEAISFFKEQKGSSELAAGKDAANKVELAKMENSKVNYIAKDFQRTFRTPAQAQTFFVERGRGFTAEQAANLIQGRSVYRDDLLNLGGQEYKAWIKLDMDSPKDRYQNYQTNQYHVPTYGFELEKVLDKFQVKELDDPKKREALIQNLENGNRPLVTTIKEGQDIKLFMEAVPRYSQLNFFREDGKPEKREQFSKEPKLDQTLQLNKGKGKEQEQGMAV